jgi:carbamoyl-phosphate synthase small subunit
MNNKKAILVLEDGTSFSGESYGILAETAGQVILNTGVVGYQEMITDPANAGKILTLTYPLIGNYGVNEKFNESEKVWVKGLVIKELSLNYSNWQARSSLDEFLQKEKVVAISGVDTRTLAVKIRDDGEMLGIISSSDSGMKDLLNKLTQFKQKPSESVLAKTSVKEITKFSGKKQRIVVVDLGILKSIVRQLSSLGLEVILVPYDTEAKEILKLKPKGVIISSGPEDDPELSRVIDTAKEILGQIPLLGISCGHQVVARALGAKLTKMKIGHHGLNYPVKSPDSPKGEITVQNHSFVVAEDSLNQKDIKIVEKNINDQTIEKLKSKKLKFISIQYYPLSAGLDEIHPVFNEFMELLSS